MRFLPLPLPRSRRAAWLVLAGSLCGVAALHAQDSMNGQPEPIVASIDRAKLTYDFLVDADLPQDDAANRKFKTVQAAYAAAPAGTAEHSTVIGIKPGVYALPGPSARGASLAINKNYITFLGLTNNRRSVVLADNRGLMQGSEDNGYILDVNATGFSLRNLTLINYVNTDYEFPGDPRKNLKKRSDVITQGVALQAQGDKHVYENVALLGRLDTIFLRTARSYFKNVYIEGTDDWMGGGQMSVWEDCTLVYPTGRGVMSASNIVFIRCRFEATRGMQFYKEEFRGAERPVALIDCIVPESTAEKRVAWIRGKAPARSSQYSLTWKVKDPSGKPATIYDATVGAPTFTTSRELSAEELRAFNPWNLLRAAGNSTPDDWDPAGVRQKYESAGAGALVYRMTVPPDRPTIRTGGAGATIGASVLPVRAGGDITWSAKSPLVSLSHAKGTSVVVTANNTTNRAEWVAINATAPNGFFVTAYVYAEPKFTDPPKLIAAPTLTAPMRGSMQVNYDVQLDGREDQSLVSWSICDDASGANPRLVAVSRDHAPLKTLPLTAGYVGKFIQVGVQPKHNVSEPGAEVRAVSARPIAASDLATTTISPVFRNFVVTPNETYASGLWTVLGRWEIAAGEQFASGYGARPAGPSALLYQNDAETGDMRIELTMTPEKTEGTGFSIPGSPADVDSTGRGDRNLHSDVYIKYDPRTRNGYALRFWRTTQSHAACMFQFYKIENGAGSPVDDHRMLTGVFKPTTQLTIVAQGNTLTATAKNNVDDQTLSLTSTVAPNRFGGAGVAWPRGSTNVYSRIEISYPDAKIK